MWETVGGKKAQTLERQLSSATFQSTSLDAASASVSVSVMYFVLGFYVFPGLLFWCPELIFLKLFMNGNGAISAAGHL